MIPPPAIITSCFIPYQGIEILRDRLPIQSDLPAGNRGFPKSDPTKGVTSGGIRAFWRQGIFVEKMNWLRIAAALLATAAFLPAAAVPGDSREFSPGVSTARGRIESPIGFLAVGARWIAAGEPVILIRVSKDARAWSDWRTLRVDPDGPAEQPASSLQFFDWDSRWLEYRWNPGESVLFDLRFMVIDPGRTPESRLAAMRRARAGRPEAREARSMPPFITRTGWDCPDGQNTRGTPSFTDVTHLIVHHSADNFAGNDYPAWVRAIWRFHVFSNGWADFGYNWAIDPDGNLYEGRGGGDNVLGAHFSCVNSGTMGVVLLGTFTSQTPSDAARRTLEELLAWKAAQRGIDPLGRAVHRGTASTMDNISGHRDGNRLPNSCTVTECPGNALYPLLPQVRQRVAELLAGSQTLLSSHFEGDLTGWSASGLWRNWDGMAWYGDPETRTYDTGKANSGELTSRVFHLEADATLRFRSLHDTEDEQPFWDQKWVEIQVDNGAWRTLDQILSPSRQWTERSYALTVRGDVRVRFRFDSVDDWKNRQEGWFLDDISVTVP